jgi:hypothetical protein
VEGPEGDLGPRSPIGLPYKGECHQIAQQFLRFYGYLEHMARPVRDHPSFFNRFARHL